jgi:hypothetical protein
MAMGRWRRAVTAGCATVLAAGLHLGWPGAIADASVANGACTVGGALTFLDGIHAVPALGQPVSLVTTSTVTSCKGEMPAGNDVITLQFDGTPLLGCGVIEGTGAVSIQFGPQSQQPFVGQGVIAGVPTAGGFTITLVPQSNPFFVGTAQFVVTSTGAALACAQGTLQSVNVTGVLEFASTDLALAPAVGAQTTQP